MTAIEKLEKDLAEAEQLVELYTKLGMTYLSIGNRAKAYTKRQEAIAQKTVVLNLKRIIKQKGQA